MFEQTDDTSACFDPNNIPDPIYHHHDHDHDHNDDHQHELHQIMHTMQNPHMDEHEPHNNNMSSSFTTHNNNNEMGFVHFDETTPTSTTDLLTLLHLPRCSFAPTNSLSFGKPTSPTGLSFLGELNPDNPSGSGSSTISYDPNVISYDPLFHLNLPPQPSPLLRDLMFQTLPHSGFGGTHQTRIDGNGNGNGNGNSSNSLFGGLDEGDQGNIINGIYQDGDHHLMHTNGIFEFTRGNASLGEGKEGKCPKNFVTERQRRQNFNDKYQHLRSLVPSPTKGDRASIVGDAINYIQELKRTVGELKLLVEKKRISKERVKRLKTEDTPGGSSGENNHVQGVDGSGLLVKPDPDESFNGSAATQLRSSWLQRKCKDTEVDVRIVDDEVTIKLVQRKKINCLLSVSRTLDELQLDLSHVAGGHVGDYYSYLFNTKICEGSSVYASAIANKLVEVVERQYAAASVSIAPSSSF